MHHYSLAPYLILWVLRVLWVLRMLRMLGVLRTKLWVVRVRDVRGPAGATHMWGCPRMCSRVMLPVRIPSRSWHGSVPWHGTVSVGRCLASLLLGVRRGGEGLLGWGVSGFTPWILPACRSILWSGVPRLKQAIILLLNIHVFWILIGNTKTST